MRKHVFAMIAALLFIFSVTYSSAETSIIDLYDSLISETNEATGNRIVIDDSAGLIKDDEIIAVMNAMRPITDYCHIALFTYPADGSNALSSVSKANLWGKLVFHDLKRYAIFIIDMQKRYLAICTNWNSDSLTSERIDAIIEEVYLFATNGEYGTCACETFNRVWETLSNRSANSE